MILFFMSNEEKLFVKIKNNPTNVRFSDMCKLVEAFGFKYRGGKGSHRIYIKEGVFEILNFQNDKGKAKPYQIRQFLSIVEKYKLNLEE